MLTDEQIQDYADAMSLTTEQVRALVTYWSHGGP